MSVSAGGAAAGATAGGAAGAGAQGGAASAPQTGQASGAQGGASGAGSQPGSSAGSGAGSPAAGADWTSSLNDEFRGFVQTKGWRGPSDAVDSYRNLEKLLGSPQDQVLKLPKEDDAEGWNQVFNRLGRPARPEDYKIEAPKEGGDPEFAKWAAGSFHELGLTQKQGQALANKWNELQQKGAQAKTEAYQAQVQQQGETLKKEWGAAYDQNINVAKSAVREFGIPGEVIEKLESAMGFAGVMKFFQQIGSKVGEPGFVTGDIRGNSGAMTPAQAQAEIASLRGDSGFIKRYALGDQAAVQKMQRLHQMAYHGDQSL